MTTSDPVTAGNTKLAIPALRPFYGRMVPLSYTLIRVTAGLMLIPHGWPKLTQQGIHAFAAAGLARRGIEPSVPLAYVIVFNETLGAVMLALGLLTRVVATMIAIEMLVIVWVYWPVFGWTGPGYEYPLMWGLVCFAIALGGGGPYSLDRKLGWEI